jgi:LVIVD repeat-containing protein
VRPTSLLSVATAALAAACASSSSPSVSSAPAPNTTVSATKPNPDPRVGLKPGWFDAGEAAWNLRLVSNTRPSKDFLNPSTPGDRRLVNSDLAFKGNYVMQGNYSGYQVWDVSNPAKVTLKQAYVCPGSQSDVSIYKNLAFVSGEATSGRLDCGLQGVPDSVSKDRLRGIRVFDITELTKPKYLANVQTCRGSHTHTVVTSPKDTENVYIYVSGSAGVRSPNELPGCSGASMAEDPNTALFRIEVIQVPLANPAAAHIVSSPRIFQDLTAPPRHAEPFDSVAAARRDSIAAARRAAGQPEPPRGGGGGNNRGGPTQCHDITVYPAIGLAGGACGGYGLLLDISNPAQPVRIGAVADSNFSFWHSATFNNDGTKVLFSDEWGGGSQPRCRVTDKPEWGADAIFTLDANKQMTFKSYYKLSAAQTNEENCVAHNGSLIPIPGRDVMVQGWYQGGISVFDWTDAEHPKEIAYFDRGPMDATKLLSAGSWSAYWFNGYIYSSDLSRGLDIFDLLPSGLLSKNEIDAAKTVRFDYFNTQDQPKLVWPPSFALVRAYLDQLERNNGLAADKIAATRTAVAEAEKLKGQAQKDALSKLATQLHTDARSAGDQPKAHKLAFAVGDLAK